MYKTEKEIMGQPQSLKQTYELILSLKEQIIDFFKNTKKVVFAGCGSSFSLCKSAVVSMNVHTDKTAFAVAAGDAMINFDYYENIFKDAVIVAPSRSGSTSEVVNLVKLAKEKFGSKCLCICAKEKSALSELSELSIELPWAFDESVCQTRTVTNLYTVNLTLAALVSGKKEILNDIEKAVSQIASFIESNKELCKTIGNSAQWNKVVVLADAEVEGIAEEGSLAFKEICQLPSNYYHVLDSRHGPMVLFDDKTLIIAVLSPKDEKYQKDFVADIMERNCTVLTVSQDEENIWGSTYHIALPKLAFAACGILFITAPQMLSLYKALSIGINPDLPKGLDPWIKL
jgi:glucosamine--fructose-6-phosphate aminotransferase (isomerizing)